VQLVKRTLCLTVATAALVTAAVTAQDGRGATSRTIDRTFVCTLLSSGGGVGGLDVLANPPLVDESRNFSAPAFIGVGSGPVTPGRVTDRSNRVFVRARPFRIPGRTVAPGVYASTRRCAATDAVVPLSPRGLRLRRGSVELGQYVDCALRGPVLVRVRAVLQSSSPWRRAQRWYAGTQANVVEAALAVTSARTRRPIVLMQLGRTGNTLLWSARNCR
jgi:hypothetical protein